MQSKGVYKWTRSKAAHKFEDGLSKFSSIPDGLVGKITVDSKGYVWIASNTDGLFCN